MYFKEGKKKVFWLNIIQQFVGKEDGGERLSSCVQITMKIKTHYAFIYIGFADGEVCIKLDKERRERKGNKWDIRTIFSVHFVD